MFRINEQHIGLFLRSVMQFMCTVIHVHLDVTEITSVVAVFYFLQANTLNAMEHECGSVILFFKWACSSLTNHEVV
jgi:hypothetical protein